MKFLAEKVPKLRTKEGHLPRFAKKSDHKTADEQLAHHLEQAENHLIGAVEQFGGANKPKRNEMFVKRLAHAQETVTSLHAEELIRIRGPLRPPRGRRKKSG